MIRLSGIVKRYLMGEEELMALAGVDLHIGRNEYVALIGPSGSGKSTLMNLIGCLDTPSEGTYVLNGRDTSSMTDNELAQVRNQEIGFVFQSFHLLPRLTVLENVMQPLVYRGIPRAERAARAKEALEAIALAIARTSSRAASASAWPWPAPWSASPRSCWPTNRRATSIRARRKKSWRCSTKSTAAARPWWW
jgi:ABC-type lipoprotein export system ATPase subunit